MSQRKKKPKPIPFPDDIEQEHTVQLLVTVPVYGRAKHVVRAVQMIRQSLRVSLHTKVGVEILSINRPRKFKTTEVPEEDFQAVE